MCEQLGVSLEQVDIQAAVHQHFADIGMSAQRRDVAYENAQARERTQVLMDIANMHGGMVLGTGDLSELALGWATYNGDHMSMYGGQRLGAQDLGPATWSPMRPREAGRRCPGNPARIFWIPRSSPELVARLLTVKSPQKTEDIGGPL